MVNEGRPCQARKRKAETNITMAYRRWELKKRSSRVSKEVFINSLKACTYPIPTITLNWSSPNWRTAINKFWPCLQLCHQPSQCKTMILNLFQPTRWICVLIKVFRSSLNLFINLWQRWPYTCIFQLVTLLNYYHPSTIILINVAEGALVGPSGLPSAQST